MLVWGICEIDVLSRQKGEVCVCMSTKEQIQCDPVQYHTMHDFPVGLKERNNLCSSEYLI